ncbi:MAG: hypothetical protein IKS17_02740, partial [Firmicutes bacterium]|nr:hypothetical protein [Bacillota bacterium]
MKRVISLVLGAAIALAACVPCVYAADAETPRQEEQAADGDVGLEEDAYGSFFEKLGAEVLDTETSEDAPVKAMDGNTYSEYVYIGSAADLRAVDGHDGGYYEFASDITLTDADWKPVKLTNAVVNGKGHWVYGLKQSGDDATGLFAWDTKSTNS